MQSINTERKIAESTIYFSLALNLGIVCSLIIFFNKFKIGIGEIFNSPGLKLIALYCINYTFYYYFHFIRFWFLKKYKNNTAHALWLHSILSHGLFFIYTTWVAHLFTQTFSYLLLLVFTPNLILIGLSLFGLYWNSKSYPFYHH